MNIAHPYPPPLRKVSVTLAIEPKLNYISLIHMWWNSWSLTLPLWISPKEEIQSGVRLGSAHWGLPSYSHRISSPGFWATYVSSIISSRLHFVSYHIHTSSQLEYPSLTVEEGGLEASVPLPQCRNTHKDVLQPIFLVNSSEPVLHELDQPDKNLASLSFEISHFVRKLYTWYHSCDRLPPSWMHQFECSWKAHFSRIVESTPVKKTSSWNLMFHFNSPQSSTNPILKASLRYQPCFPPPSALSALSSAKQ